MKTEVSKHWRQLGPWADYNNIVSCRSFHTWRIIETQKKKIGEIGLRIECLGVCHFIYVHVSWCALLWKLKPSQSSQTKTALRMSSNHVLPYFWLQFQCYVTSTWTLRAFSFLVLGSFCGIGLNCFYFMEPTLSCLDFLFSGKLFMVATNYSHKSKHLCIWTESFKVLTVQISRNKS